MKTITVDNVNHAIPLAVEALLGRGERVSPRGMETIEYPEPVCTHYKEPMKRVLFDPDRDANPFFHLMESLWILGGCQDVSFPAKFNSRIKNYSDDGTIFHGAYGFRLRSGDFDQLNMAVEMFREDPETRRVVLQIWDYSKDLGTESKDLPCNDLVILKVRRERLNMAVINRSNDMIWGCYGANIVQFSMLQEYLAARIGVGVGDYRQVSDSFHVYTGNPQWAKLSHRDQGVFDLYTEMGVKPYPLVKVPETFDRELKRFLDDEFCGDWTNPFFPDVAIPVYKAWFAHKEGKRGAEIAHKIKAEDWRIACTEWLSRRSDSV